MKFKIKIETGNAAFEDNPGFEIARILRGVITQLGQNELPDLDGVKLYDEQGNSVGKITVKED